ncbi:MAG: transglutaminase domain-containing protein [Flavobacteriaceae bacterium]
MLRLSVLIWFFAAVTAYGSGYKQLDEHVRNYPYFTSLDHLSIRIMNDFESDEERVRAAFIWIIYNMDYGRSYEVIFQADKHFPFYSEIGRKYQLRQLELEKIDQSFRGRLGVCLDYSLILKELCYLFKIPSKVVIGVTKTDVRDLKGEPLLKNHSWNAVLIDGDWQLLDPTWASGQLDQNLLHLFGSYIEQFFFPDPADFIKSHLPANPDWQLLENPVDPRSFASAPSFFPEYFIKEVKLSPGTKGIISLAEYNEYLIMFDKLPATDRIHYSIDGSMNLKKMEIKKAKDQPYLSIIKLKKRLKKKYHSLTVFMDYRPIVKFRIEN